jgi:hypothetical protein
MALSRAALISISTVLGIALLATACKKDDDDDDGPDGDEAPAKSGSTVQTDPRCLPDGGFVDNACETCENAGCCATRFGCYDNASCDAANKLFDDCLTAAATDQAKITKCWSDLSASSSVAKARVDCQRSKCQAECKVP